MEINSRQYAAAQAGRFSVQCNAYENEEIILNMLTARGRRFVPVGRVSEVRALGFGRCLVRAERLEHVEGIY
ncbi:hypothetical protein D3C76_1121870 [compost metagenome]